MTVHIPNNLSHDIAAKILSLPEWEKGEHLRSREMEEQVFEMMDFDYWQNGYKGNNGNPLTMARFAHSYKRALQFLEYLGDLSKRSLADNPRFVEYTRSPSGTFAISHFAAAVLSARFKQAEKEIDLQGKKKPAVPLPLHNFLRWAFEGTGGIVAEFIQKNPFGMSENTASAMRFQIVNFLSTRATWDFAISIVNSVDQMLCAVRASSVSALTDRLVAAEEIYKIGVEFGFIRVADNYAGPFAA